MRMLMIRYSLPVKPHKMPPPLMSAIVAAFGLHQDQHCPVLPKLQRTSRSNELYPAQCCFQCLQTLKHVRLVTATTEVYEQFDDIKRHRVD